MIPSLSVPPPAFLCTKSSQIMTKPVMAFCGHLFEEAVASDLDVCPKDQYPLQNTLPYTELGKTIAVWKNLVAKPPVPATSSSSSEHFTEETAVLKPPAAPTFRPSSTHIPQAASVPPLPPQEPLRIIQNAHLDDIHGLTLITPGRFVTGSKDGTLKMWNPEGTCVANLRPPHSNQGYKYWVTALAKLGESLFASGTRMGSIDLWDPAGRHQGFLRYAPSSQVTGQYVSKERNKLRINCITPSQSSEPGSLFYTGTACFVQLWNIKTKNIVRTVRADPNDWVYCIEPHGEKGLLVVIGSRLEYWNMQSPSPKIQVIVKNSEKQDGQRAHISAINWMEDQQDLLMASVFDGSVRVIDIARHQQIRNLKQHTGRVWSVINLMPNAFASSADDKTILIWDLRVQNPVDRIKDQPGRVSNLLRINPQTFISASCPDDPYHSLSKASLSFWDIRKLSLVSEE